MDKLFTNKIALITGAASGIGRSTAILFADKGAKVVVSDIADGTGTVKIIQENGGDAIFIKCDISKEADVKTLISETVKKYGKIDFAFNNAGTEGVSAMIQDYSEKDFDHIIDINLKGTWLCMKYEIQEMLKQGKGSIINCSSIAGLVGFQQAAIYTASKHGVNGMTKSAALENAKNGIRINAICPGVIDTPMIDRATGGKVETKNMYAQMEPMGRLGLPEEIAEVTLWLSSDASSFITGQTFAVDGGWVAQ